VDRERINTIFILQKTLIIAAKYQDDLRLNTKLLEWIHCAYLNSLWILVNNIRESFS